MRVFGLWSLRVAFEASFVSRKRFEMCAIAPKIRSERIVSSWGMKADTTLFNSLNAFALPELVQMTIRYVAEFRSVVRRRFCGCWKVTVSLSKSRQRLNVFDITLVIERWATIGDGSGAAAAVKCRFRGKRT
jgi:hypothetical protein